mmetsp:Transcript_2482/g.6628  ORF Transcript_2482/g.6628 Transcript_2482/m.6628 type:complete len:216 (-) Transcript_2482:443-1090(-)
MVRPRGGQGQADRPGTAQAPRRGPGERADARVSRGDLREQRVLHHVQARQLRAWRHRLPRRHQVQEGIRRLLLELFQAHLRPAPRRRHDLVGRVCGHLLPPADEDGARGDVHRVFLPCQARDLRKGRPHQRELERVPQAPPPQLQIRRAAPKIPRQRAQEKTHGQQVHLGAQLRGVSRRQLALLWRCREKRRQRRGASEARRRDGEAAVLEAAEA